MEAALENGGQIKGSLVVARDVAHMIELQEQAKSLKCNQQLTMVARIVGEVTAKPANAVEILVPVFNHLALVKCLAACLTGGPPQLDVDRQPQVKRIEKTGIVAVKNMQTLRLFIVVKYVPRKWQMTLAEDAAMCVKMMGFHHQFRTVRFDNEGAAIVGLIEFQPEHIEEMLKISGTHGVFVSKLASCQLKKPEVQWLAKSPQERDLEYFQRATELAAKESLPLAWRMGGPK